MNITVCGDETEEQAKRRWLHWRYKRYELAGYDGSGSFIFKGRRCISSSLLRGPFTFTHSPKASAAAADANEASRFERDRESILRNRAVREATNASELAHLLALYGVA